MASPYALDFSPLANALDSNRQHSLALQQQEMARNRLAMEQERLGFERARQPFELAQLKAQTAATKDDALKRKAGLYGNFLEAHISKMSPEDRAAAWPRFLASGALDKDDLEHPTFGPMLKDPELGYKLMLGFAAPYRDDITKRTAEADIAAKQASTKSVEDQEGRAKRLADHQHQLSIDLAKAKSKMEVEEIMRKAQALGLDVGQPTPPAAAPPAGAVPQPAPRPNAVPGKQAAPTDPYLQLTQPAISPEQELAQRKARAAASAVAGDLKGAGKIMAKDEEPKEYQTKDATFAERMARSEIGLRGILGKDNAKYDPANYLRSWLPDWNLINSSDWRNYVGSAREWIAAMLRKDTGAAVTETEWNLYFPTYFPQPGDDLNVQKLKMDRRIQSARGLRGSSGPAFDKMFPNFDAEQRQRLRDQDPATYGASDGGGWSARRID